MKKLFAASIAGLALVATSYVGFALTRESEPAPEPRLSTPVATDRLPELNRLIGVFEKRVATSSDALNLWTLGAHYLDRASIDGGVPDLISARDVLDRAAVTNAGNPNVDIPLASAVLGLHDFERAVTLTEPHLLDLTALAVYGDASMGFGEIADAAMAYDRLQRKLPDDPAVVVRQASLAWEIGDVEAALTHAAEASGLATQPRERSFYLAYLGQLFFESGQFEEAESVLNEALALDPENLSAKIELAHAIAGQSDIERAKSLLSEVLAKGADADAGVVLGDLHTLTGDTAAAEEAYALLEVAANEYPDAFRRDVSLFLSNKGIDVERALQLAEADLETRHDSGAYDTLAWALYSNGKFAEARLASDQALALGTSDASAYFHAGMISVALGDEDRGHEEIKRALDMNPFFNALLAKQAREIVGG